MSNDTSSFDRFWTLVEAACSGSLSDEDVRELQAILRGNASAQRLYLEYCRLHSELRFHCKVQRSSDVSLTKIRQPVSPPPLGFLATAYHGTVGFFSQEMPFGILVATLVFIVGGIIGSVMTVHHYTQFAGQSQTSAERSFATMDNKEGADTSSAPKEMVFVGQITGLVDVKWSEDKDFLPPLGYAAVPLGRKYKLDSGLMEITYDTGAKVILQGPVAYEVESANGGYMSVGKLTGKVDVEKAKGFFIRTPNATITDLGTEFGVEVKPDKATNVCVFRGVVETQRDSRSGGTPVRERLMAGEAIQYVSGDAPSRRTTVKSLGDAPLPLTAKIYAAAREARQSRLLVAPSALVATAYHRVWDAKGKLSADNDRGLAFGMATDCVFGRGEKSEVPRSSFDTLNANGSKTDFVGLLYGRRVRIDRIKVFLGHQFADGGSWQQSPRVFIQINPVDSDRTPPENDPDNWRELPLPQLSYGNAFNAHADANPGKSIELLLTGCSEEQRTGYGWAIGGVKGDGDAGYVSITELRGYGVELKIKGDNGGT